MSASLTSNYQFSSPYFRWLGYVVWLAMLLMSIVFYKERATFMDGGFQLTELINKGEFGIYYYRMTNPLTQVLALAAIKLNLSLKAVMIAYSINFIFFFTIIYHFITGWCKNDILGWVQIAFFTLFTTQSFYLLPPEYYQGMSLILLWFAMILRFNFKVRWLLPVLALLLIPIIFDHLLLSAFFAFLWCFFFLHEEKLRIVEYWILAAVMVIIFVIHQEFYTSWYDTMKMENFQSNWQIYFPHFHDIPAHLIFLGKCISTYYFFPIILVVLVVNYGWQFGTNLKSKFKDFIPLLKLGLVLGFCASYILINHIGDPASTHFFYSEMGYTGLAVPITLALIIDFVPRLKRTYLVLTSLVVVMVIRLGTIAITHNTFEGRHDWMRDQLHISGSNRLIIHSEDAPKDVYIMDWSIPYESLLITALEGPKEAKSMIITTEEKQYKDFLDQDDLLLEVMRQTKSEELNKRYFDLGRGKYVIK